MSSDLTDTERDEFIPCCFMKKISMTHFATEYSHLKMVLRVFVSNALVSSFSWVADARLYSNYPFRFVHSGKKVCQMVHLRQHYYMYF